MITFPSDIEIAQAAEIKPIKDIAHKLGIPEDLLEQYGKYKAKLPLSLIDENKVKKGHLILVTAITPTPADFEPFRVSFNALLTGSAN